MPGTLHSPLHLPAPTTLAPWQLRAGAQPLPGGGTCFRVWAPRAQHAHLHLHDGSRERTEPMHAVGSEADGSAGWFELTVSEAPPGARYGFILDNGPVLPDPVSRAQPDGVHGLSRVVDPDAHAWHDREWRGLPLDALVFYELHVGTFTHAGTFAGVVERLPYLRALGVTAVELMPVAAFPGARNWGYDGVSLYAPHAAYGGPEGLKTLVDACHQAGLAVVLDVVYNHLGPEGNYLNAFGPYFTNHYATPWGDALNFDGPESGPVRRYFIENALYWLTEYHIDALRLDAVHGIYDFGAQHVLAELAEHFHAQAVRLGRHAHLIAESDLNDTRVITPPTVGGWGLDGQWMDDFHHAVHARLTGDREGYFADFGGVQHVRKAMERGFVYDGQYSRYRRRQHGNASGGLPGHRFVVCTQNHDQIANASSGARHSEQLSRGAQKLAAALLVCSPYLPMLFMGQEYGEPAPFYYFTSHGDTGLAEAVINGRRAEHATFHERPKRPFADPQAPETFEACRLDWTLPGREPHAALLRWYTELLRLRAAVPCLHNGNRDLLEVHADPHGDWLVLERADAGGSSAALYCNLSGATRDVPRPAEGAPSHAAEGMRLALWSGAERFRGDEPGEAPEPPEYLPAGDADTEPTLRLGPWGVALYLRESAEGPSGGEAS